MVQQSEANIVFGSVGQWALHGDSATPPTTLETDSLPVEPLDLIGSKTIVKKTLASSSSNTSRRARGATKEVNLSWAKKIYYTIDSLLNRRSLEKKLRPFNVVHVQSLFDYRILTLLANSKNLPPMIVSIWGSDVLRCADMRRCALHQKVLRKAKLITVSGIEIRQILLAKYGHDLNEKIRETFFSPNDQILHQIASTSATDAKSTIAQTFGLDPQKTLVCVGHNGSEANQHIPVLDELGKLPSETRNGIQVVCPMTYGGNDAYLQQVRDSLSENKLNGILLTEFIEDSAVAMLRKASDLFIFVPISDSFSATVSQALIAGNITIVGSWLPYARRRRGGFKYWEIDCLNDLRDLTASLLDDLEGARQKVTENEALGMEFFDPKRMGTAWADVYQEALQP